MSNLPGKVHPCGPAISLAQELEETRLAVQQQTGHGCRTVIVDANNGVSVNTITVFGQAVPVGQKVHFWTKVGELNDGRPLEVPDGGKHGSLVLAAAVMGSSTYSWASGPSGSAGMMTAPAV